MNAREIRLLAEIATLTVDLKCLAKTKEIPWTTALEELREKLDEIDGRDPYPTKIPYPGEGWENETDD